MLGHFHLLDDLTEGSTISSTVLTANSDLLGVVSLNKCHFETVRSCELPHLKLEHLTSPGQENPVAHTLTILIKRFDRRQQANPSDYQQCGRSLPSLQRFSVDTTSDGQQQANAAREMNRLLTVYLHIRRLYFVPEKFSHFQGSRKMYVQNGIMIPTSLKRLKWLASQQQRLRA